ncbi:hypothetical protein [Caudoviricetes sp.]|nr:hypothetical protein [Caudoviricetes sp.]
MGWWADFTGKTAKKSIEAANARATGYLETGRNEALEAMNRGYGDAQNYLSPYAQQGTAANKLYSDALGLNGYGAQQALGQYYAASDPFRKQNEDMAMRAITRRYNAMGSATSGAAQLAAARALAERGSQDYNAYLSRLGGLAQQGQGIGLAQSGLAANQGNALGSLYTNYGNQQAGNAVNYGNAQAQASNIFGNNIFGALGAMGNFFTGYNSIPKVK